MDQTELILADHVSHKRYWLMNMFSYSLHMTLHQNVAADVWRNYFKASASAPVDQSTMKEARCAHM